MVHKGRPKGIFNCPFKVGSGFCICKLDDRQCKTYFEGLNFWCRGWLPGHKPSPLQLSKSQEDKLF